MKETCDGRSKCKARRVAEGHGLVIKRHPTALAFRQMVLPLGGSVVVDHRPWCGRSVGGLPGLASFAFRNRGEAP